MITYENNRPFDFDRVKYSVDDLMKVEGVNRFTLTNDAAKEISTILKLDDCKSEVELRAIRNAVVKTFANLENKVLHINPATGNYFEGERPSKEDYEIFDKYNMYSSAITCVIDNELWNKGYEV